ncbi:CRISPR-associated protein Cas4 [Halorussus marinus]|uniref:CRISPR-associated protein Cas4 n=1 Tax=Halorussus marinus TaxID=2505976 RepID=UPI00106ED887|nr:hypothetical protein [Halorussus marinus]
MSPIAFSDLATAAYCPRKLYYRRKEDERSVPDEVADCRNLAFRYEELLGASDDSLADLPIGVTPAAFRRNLERARERFQVAWPELRAPTGRERLLDGRECRGVVHKVLEFDASELAPAPSMVFAGSPPEQGVWEPQSVRMVAAAKALSWERERSVERAFAEYPGHGIVRELDLTTRRKAAYRRAVETVRALDGPPPRLGDDAKCEPCEYRAECGVKTRSLKSLLGL